MNANRTYAEDFLGDMSPAGQRVQQTLSPYQQFRVSGTVTPPNQGMGFDDPLGAFEGLDPADDSFLEKQSVIFQSAPPELFRNPAVQNRIRQANAQHAEAQSYFKEDPELVDFYISQVQSGVAPAVAIGELRKRAQDRSLKGLGLKSGLLEEEYESLRDPVTGQVDRFKMLDFINRAERASKVKAAAAPKELPPEAYSKIDKARNDTETLMAIANDPARLGAYYKDKTKKEMLGDKVNRTDEAWKMIDEELRGARDNYERQLQAYGRNYVIPPEFGSNQPVQVQESVTTESLPDQPQQGTVAAPQKEPLSSYLERNKRKL